uniref:THAP domain-containing protein 1 n=1 Tax=Salarias fasciatus TaxID=181472 RepID=A0A672GMR6_SALFA
MKPQQTKRKKYNIRDVFKLQQTQRGSSEHCCVPLCSASSRYNSEISFHRFPKDTGLLCSRHFEPSKINITAKGRRVLIASAVPSLFEWNDFQQKTRASTEPMVPMLLEHDYGASSTVCVEQEHYDKMREEIEMLRQQLQTLHLQSLFGLQRAATTKMVRVTCSRKSYASSTTTETPLTRPTVSIHHPDHTCASSLTLTCTLSHTQMSWLL